MISGAACRPREWIILNNAAPRDVRFTPQSGHVQCTSPCPLWANSGLMQRSKGALFNHLAGTREQRGRHSEAERLSGFEVDCQFVLGRRLNRHVSRLFTFKDSIDVAGRASVLVEL